MKERVKANCRKLLIGTFGLPLCLTFMMSFGTTTSAADGPTKLVLQKYGDPVGESTFSVKSVTTTEIDDALSNLPLYPDDFTHDLFVDLFDELDELESDLADKVKEVLEANGDFDMKWGLKAELKKIFYVDVKADFIEAVLTNQATWLTVILGTFSGSSRARFRITAFGGSVLLGHCTVTIYARALKFGLNYNVISGSVTGAGIAEGTFGAEHVSCSGGIVALKIFESYAKKKINQALNGSLGGVAGQAVVDSDLFGLADLSDAIADSGLVPDPISIPVTAAIDELVQNLSDYEGSGIMLTLGPRDQGDSNFVKLRVEALLPSMDILDDRYSWVILDHYPTDTSWVDLELINPRFMEIEAQSGTVTKAYVDQVIPPPPGSGQSDPPSIWYAIGAYSDNLESVWSKPQYVHVVCLDIAFTTCTFHFPVEQ